MIQLNEKPKGYHNLDRFFFQGYRRDKKEELCVRFMEEEKYEELEQLLQELHEDKTWKCSWKENNENLFQYILEMALMRKDQKAVDIVLQVVRIVSPLSYLRPGLITEDEVLFRKLIKSRKLDCSPNHVMTIEQKKGRRIDGTLKGNLMEILVFLHKPELVRILLEEGYTYRKSNEMMRDRTLGDCEMYPYDPFYEQSLINIFYDNPLEMAISICDKEITKIFMEQGKYEFHLKQNQMVGSKKKQEEFFLWMMAEYPEQLMEQMDLKWILTECGGCSYKGKILEFYKERKGLEAFLQELDEAFIIALDQDWGFFDYGRFMTLSVISAVNQLKRMAKTKEEKEKIGKTEQKGFELIRDSRKFCDHYYPVLFFIVVDYWYRREKELDREIVEEMLFIYFYWGKEEWKKTGFGKIQSCLTDKETEAAYQRAVKSMNNLIEKADIRQYTPSISLEPMKEKADKKRISVVMDKLNPEQNGKIEQLHGSASFLAFLLLQDSPMLVKKAWNRKFLTGRNLSEAVKFAVGNEKKKILSCLYEYAANDNTELEEYVL